MVTDRELHQEELDVLSTLAETVKFILERQESIEKKLDYLMRYHKLLEENSEIPH